MNKRMGKVTTLKYIFTCICLSTSWNQNSKSSKSHQT